MDKKSLFWLSGVGSGFLYLALVVLIFFNFAMRPKKLELSGQNIAVDLLLSERSNPMPTSQPEQKTEKQEEVKKPIERQEPVKQQQEEVKKHVEKKEQIEKEPEINDAKNILKSFSKKEEPKPKQITQQQSSSQKSPTNAKQLLSSLTLRKNAPSVTFSSGSGKSNEYLSKVAGIIKSGWSPYKNDIGLSAVIYINIKVDGTFDFYIKKQSISGDFNDRLVSYLNDLKTKGFPPPEDKKSYSVEFTFIPKE